MELQSAQLHIRTRQNRVLRRADTNINSKRLRNPAKTEFCKGAGVSDVQNAHVHEMTYTIFISSSTSIFDAMFLFFVFAMRSVFYFVYF